MTELQRLWLLLKESLLRSWFFLERIFGASPAKRADWLYRLGWFYHRNGRFIEAESYYRQSLTLMESVYRPGHSRTSWPLRGLAYVYLSQGKDRLLDAAAMLERVLVVLADPTGLMDAHEIIMLRDLSDVNYQLGRYEAAETGYRRVLASSEKTHGDHHLDLAVDIEHLANVLFATRRYSDAEPLYRRAATIRDEAQGPDHPDTFWTRHYLARSYDEQAKHEEAERLYMRLLKSAEERLGSGDPLVAELLSDLGAHQLKKKDVLEAQRFYQASIAILEKRGPYCLQMVFALVGLAYACGRQARHDESRSYLLRALAIQQTHLGQDHPDIAETLYRLAEADQCQEKLEDAEALYRQCLAIQERSLAPDDPSLGFTLHDLAAVCEELNNHEEAEQHYLRSLTILEKTWGSTDPRLFEHLLSLAEYYEERDNHVDAGRFYRRFAALRDIRDEDRSDFVAGLERYAAFLTTTMNPEQAERISARAKQLRATLPGSGW